MQNQHKFAMASLILLAIFTTSGCSTNPATGDQSFTGLMSLNDEIRIGRREHSKILKSFGGQYKDEAIKNYVSTIGNQLAAKSELPNIKWTFTVLNSPVINALALPGGYIYVTRGLMALASNEAELAGVLAHEIGHVTARHTAQRYSSSLLAGGVSIAASIFLGSSAGDLANFAGKAAIQSYSRKQEFEADTLGVRYLARGNYNTSAMGTFLKKLRAHSQLEARRHKKDPANVDQGDMFATHPRTIDRVNRAIAATTSTKTGHRLGTVDYMERLHNMVYGDDPKEGLIKGQMFIHPEMRFRFIVPDGFLLINTPRAVIAKGPSDAAIQFDTVNKPYNNSMVNYIKRIWAPKTTFPRVDKIKVNGMPGATAKTQIRKKNGVFDLQLTAIKYNNSRIYRFIFLTRSNQTKLLYRSLRQTTFSLKNISHSEAKKIRPARVLVKAVGAENSIKSFTQLMSAKPFSEETFRVINGLQPYEPLKQGKLIKIISE